MSVKIIFCYAHEDELLLNKLKTHLKPLQRQGLIDMWYDREISAGTEWAREIDKHLNEAQLILLLISPDFMDSDYCYGIEMKRAMERQQRGEARVIPIILRPVYWQGEPLGTLQALPTDAIPVTDPAWFNLDRALFNVTEGVRKIIDNKATNNPFPLQAPLVETSAMRQAMYPPQMYNHNPSLAKIFVQQLLSLNKGLFSLLVRLLKRWHRNQYFIGVAAGILASIQYGFLGFITTQIYQHMYDYTSITPSPLFAYLFLFSFLVLPWIICLIAGYIRGKIALKRTAGLLVGSVAGVTYSLFVILWFQLVDINPFIIFLIKLAYLVICGLFGLLGSLLATRKHSSNVKSKNLSKES